MSRYEKGKYAGGVAIISSCNKYPPANYVVLRRALTRHVAKVAKRPNVRVSMALRKRREAEEVSSRRFNLKGRFLYCCRKDLFVEKEGL